MSKMNRLEEILQIVTTNSEEAVDDFLTLLSPEKSTKEEIQSTFEDVVGYDPTSYFDKQDIGEILTAIAEDDETPEETSLYINDNKDEVVQEVYDVFEENKPGYFDDVINGVLEEKTGWSTDESDDENGYEDEEEY